MNVRSNKVKVYRGGDIVYKCSNMEGVGVTAGAITGL